jgi:hypothetical protein
MGNGAESQYDAPERQSVLYGRLMVAFVEVPPPSQKSAPAAFKRSIVGLKCGSCRVKRVIS